MSDTDEVLATEETEHALFTAIVGTIFGAIIGLIGLPVFLIALDLGLTTSMGPGPGLLPFISGLLMFVLGLSYAIQKALELRKILHAKSENTGIFARFLSEVPDGITRSLAVVASLIVLALIIELLGFQLSMLLFLFFHLKIMGKQAYWISIGLAIVGSFGIFMLFNGVFHVQLPTSAIDWLRIIGL